MSPDGYIPRIVDQELDELSEGLPAIAIEGPRGVGKTETALRRAKTVHRLDDADQYALIRARRRRLIEGELPILIDEWQRMPESWDVVRRAVDADRTPGRFLLTGSATPTRKPTHSGAGRIVTVRMRPMSLAERMPVVPTVSLGSLLSGTRPDLTGETDATIVDYVQEIMRSGFPGIRSLSSRLRRSALDGYLDRIAEHDFNDLDRRVRDPQTLRRWLVAYAAATSTTASFETVRDAAATSQGHKPARSTTLPYRTALEQLWLLDEVSAWHPTRNPLRRLAGSPVHHLADPALAARLLGCDADELLAGTTGGPAIARNGPLLGALFESLVTLSVKVYAQQNEARVLHLRTHGGEREVDLIVERGYGTVVALEVKLTSSVEERDVRHLRWLSQRLGPDLLDAAVITTGSHAYRRRDGIGVIPAALLGA